MQKIFYGALLVCAILLGSCDNQKRLAQDMNGEWTSGVERLDGVNAPVAQIIDNLAFVSDSTGKSGMVVATGMIDVTVAPPFNGQLVGTVSESIAAQSTVQGTWAVIDEDEVTLNFDFSTMEVNIDPAADGLQASLIGTQYYAAVDSVGSAQALPLKAQLVNALREHYSAMRLLDDVQVKKNVLKFEIAKRDYVFHRESIN